MILLVALKNGKQVALCLVELTQVKFSVLNMRQQVQLLKLPLKHEQFRGGKLVILATVYTVNLSSLLKQSQVYDHDFLSLEVIFLHEQFVVSESLEHLNGGITVSFYTQHVQFNWFFPLTVILMHEQFDG